MLFVAAVGILCSCAGNKETKQANYRVIPLPAEIISAEGTPFTLTESTKIVVANDNEKMKRNAEFLSEFLQQSVGIKPSITNEKADKNAIILQLQSEGNGNNEAYTMEVNANIITISGASEAGIFYGIQTLRKATPVGKHISVQYAPVIIKDTPRFAYRGMMLDVARHFVTVDFVKKYIDLLALHNVNRFHWHLTEDQGWRIEIKAYPKLTEIGSQRKETVIGRNTGQFDGKAHGGFYTQEQIKDIVEYAKERYITVVPEIDLPGHMLAALASYPEFGCTGGPYEVGTQWGIFDDVLCPGKESTFTFLETVLSEVIDLIPSKYIHIGGDECPKVRWEKCPDCQKRIKELKLKGDDKHSAEHYLQSYVTARVEKFLNERGRSIIGWDEILEGELAPNATVMSWRGMKGGIQAAQMGHDVIMTPTTYCYFDYYQTADTENEPLAIGGFLPLEQVYRFEPATDELTTEQKKHIIGAQANLWTEYIPTEDHVEYMTIPRLAAMCEVQWMQADKKNYEDFIKRLPQLLTIYDNLEYNYATHVFDIDAKLTPDFNKNALNVALSTIDNAPIYYTLDGSEPSETSTKYDGVFTIDKEAELKAVAIRENGKKSSVFSEKVHVNKATFKPITLLTHPDPNYAYNGANLLVDGLKGNNSNYRTGRWMGFQGEDMIAIVDLLEATEISSAAIRNAVVTGDWIFDASEIIIEASDDNKTFNRVHAEKIDDTHTTHWQDVSSHKVTFEPVTARYFKVTVKCSTMPEWHPGKGKRAYIFVDEIELN